MKATGFLICLIFLISGCVATQVSGVKSESGLVGTCPDRAYRFPVTNTGDRDIVLAPGKTVWIQVPAGTFDADKNPTTEEQFLKAVQSLRDRRVKDETDE